MKLSKPVRSRLKHLILAAACGAAFTSCSITAAGSSAIPEATASLQIGKTTYPELESQLGKPGNTNQKGNRRTANWNSGAVGMGAGSIVGSNTVIYNSLGVEYDEKGVVRRKVTHTSQQKTTLGSPYQSSRVAEAVKNPGPYTRMKRISQIEAELGPPQFKRLTLLGEMWMWASYNNSLLTVEIDRSGRVLALAVQ
ncbi:hypothetical protein OKA05_13995 [Luteolibacter arcticus]|uniref:Lipoprotein n=1 Tax=Luteolibacter arcticus TaxID=1581411 RepID=A0ABT3GJH4_9BACT|nr:hypothetical protein [Luteolibacter arcticus]MCW1923673.1 hypothetical protein [Luteolibacter arcticus]